MVAMASMDHPTLVKEASQLVAANVRLERERRALYKDKKMKKGKMITWFTIKKTMILTRYKDHPQQAEVGFRRLVCSNFCTSFCATRVELLTRKMKMEKQNKHNHLEISKRLKAVASKL